MSNRRAGGAGPTSGQTPRAARVLPQDRVPGPAPDPSGESYQPGQRYGLPADGPRSVAGAGRRLGALVVDWLACMIISLAVFRTQEWTIVLFGAEVWLLTALTGFTLGKRLFGIRVARLDGKPVGFLSSLVRTILLLLVVPPLIFDRDLRGLHDKAARTIVLRA